MTKAKIAGGAVATVLVLLALAAVDRILRADVESAAPTPPANAPANAVAAAEAHHGFLYGRIATREGATYEGRVRFGGGEEAAWGDYFNGAKEENPWVAHVPLERRPRESYPIEIFGVTILRRERPIDLRRLFMARYGDTARIEAHGVEVRVTLKSGSVFDLDRTELSVILTDVALTLLTALTIALAYGGLDNIGFPTLFWGNLANYPWIRASIGLTVDRVGNQRRGAGPRTGADVPGGDLDGVDAR